jgi:thiamine biosynthesis lipoprotein
MQKKIAVIVIILVLAGAGVGYVAKREVLFAGKTMGTTYHVKVVAGWYKSTGTLSGKIESRLDEINRSMSVFRKDSEISQFNNLTVAGEKFPVSEDFYRVMVLAAKIHEWTGHAWDGTVMPLVNLWGFGNRGPRTSPPDPKSIGEARQSVGFSHIVVGEDRRLTKNLENVTLDLASIAKGYGVDAVATLLRENGFSNFLVEIGGEVFAAGVRKDGKPWRVGINLPEKNAAPTEIYRSLPLREQALATSGDYRNFFEVSGIRYSHIIDPATGYPVANGVVSASVVADNCTIADGLATAILVMGHEKSLELVSRLPGIDCFIVVREPDGTFTNYASAGIVPVE